MVRPTAPASENEKMIAKHMIFETRLRSVSGCVFLKSTLWRVVSMGYCGRVKSVQRTIPGPQTVPQYPSRTVGPRRLIRDRYCFAGREESVVLPPAFWETIAAPANPRIHVCTIISAPVENAITCMSNTKLKLT